MDWSLDSTSPDPCVYFCLTQDQRDRPKSQNVHLGEGDQHDQVAQKHPPRSSPPCLLPDPCLFVLVSHLLTPLFSPCMHLLPLSPPYSNPLAPLLCLNFFSTITTTKTFPLTLTFHSWSLPVSKRQSSWWPKFVEQLMFYSKRFLLLLQLPSFNSKCSTRGEARTTPR